jgi:transglutaminase-like putative cysteine protease
MVFRHSWLAGIAGLILAVARLERLLRPSVEGPPWELVLVGAAALGAAITWLCLTYRAGKLVVAVDATAALLIMTQIAAPGTGWSIFPGSASFDQLGSELAYSGDVIRTGVAPILPLAGVIAILSVVFLALGSLLAWGLRRNHPYPAVLAPLAVYLQFSILDNLSSGPWTLVFLVLLGASLLAVAFDSRRRDAAAMTSAVSRARVPGTVPSLTAAALIVMVSVAGVSAAALADAVPGTGLIHWRVPSALTGSFYGGVSYNPFVGIRQQLVSRAGAPLLVAEVQGELDPAEVYWRLLTLDTFDGTQWYADHPSVGRAGDLESYEDPDQAFRGPTASVLQRVTILALRQDWLPAAYAPIEVSAVNRALEKGLRIKQDDGSLHFDALTYRGMTYTVLSEIPTPDTASLILGSDGKPSPMFSVTGPGQDAPAAREAPQTFDLKDERRYLALPSDLDPRIGALARKQTRGLSTDFEKGVALEWFFRSAGTFRYSVAVSPGHAAADLASWLLDPLSPNYRIGYCEQFATAMAVMARQVGVPSRVVLGFAPGMPLEDGRVVVLDRNAHAWVELWMPTQGWVRFDPTPRGAGDNPATLSGLPFDPAYLAGLPEPGTTSGTVPNPRHTPAADEEEDRGAGSPAGLRRLGKAIGLPSWTIVALLVTVAVGTSVPGAKWVRRRRRLRLLSLGDISAAWREIIDRLVDLGRRPSQAWTPAEIAAATDPAMAPLAEVYGETLYAPGRNRPFDIRRIAVASRSLQETEDRLALRFSPLRRLAARYRLLSLLPGRPKRSAAR